MSYNYIKVLNDDTEIATKHEPSFLGLRDAKYVGDNPDVLIGGIWYPTTTGSDELVTNGTFDTDTTVGWATVDSTFVASGGLATFDTSTGGGSIYYIADTVIGESYSYSIKIFSVSDVTGLRIGDNINGTEHLFNESITAQTYSGSFIATSTTTYLSLLERNASNATTVILDDVSIYKEAKPILGKPYATPQTYLPVKVEIDSLGNPVDLHDFDVPDLVRESIHTNFIKSHGNRKVIDLGTIFNDTRYVVDNPFGNDNYMDCDVKAEVYVNGIWSETGFVDSTSAIAEGYGTKASSNLTGIVIQTGVTRVYTHSSSSGGGHGIESNSTSAPARVIVTYQGVTK